MVMKRVLFCIFYSNFANPLIELGLYLLEIGCSHLAGYWIPGEVLGWSTGYSTLVVSYQYQSSCESW